LHLLNNTRAKLSDIIFLEKKSSEKEGRSGPHVFSGASSE